MTRRHSTLQARAGFTLVETLVSIAIVGLLMAVLVPGLRSVAEASKSAACMSNLRQMASAAHSYSVTWRDAYPAAIVYKKVAGGVRTDAWDFTQHPDGTVTPGALWLFTDTPNDVMQCPGFDGASTFGNDPASGYNYNTSFIGAEGRFPELGPDGAWKDGWALARRGLPMAAHRRTSETALFGDAGWKSGANKFMRAPSGNAEGDLGVVYSGAQSFRHVMCANVAFLDGSVRPCQECCEGMHATPALLSDLLDFPHNGFLSNDDTAYDPR